MVHQLTKGISDVVYLWCALESRRKKNENTKNMSAK